MAVFYAAKIEDCSFQNCVILNDDELSSLLSESILTKHQIDYLHQHYYHKVELESIDLDTINTTTHDLHETITAYNVVTTFMSTANLLYCCGCLILTVAYIILIFWFRRDSPYIQIGLTFTYHYIFHIIADLLSHTISSRILAAILYVCCCNMPTICLFIYLFHPKLLNGYGVLQETYHTVKTVMVSNAKNNNVNIARWDIYFAKMIPNIMFIYVILLCFSSMITPFIYAFIFKTEFIGIFAVFTATLYVLLITFCLFSLKSDIINDCITLISKSCQYGDSRCLYMSILYWLSMFIIAYFTQNSMLCTVCLVSGLNAFCWSFPSFLFIDIFKPEITINWDVFNTMIAKNKLLDGIDVILSLLQQRGNMRYRAFIMTNIGINWLILQICIYYSSWVAVPYSVISLFCLSYTVKADMKWSILVHLPIAYTLFKACFAYIYIIDIATLESLSWIAPQNILLWIITTILRFGTSLAASLQITRAIYWITIPKHKWELQTTNIIDMIAHSVTLYVICSVFLYFTYLEPNAFISFLFEIFGISYGSMLVLSIGQILTSTHKPWIFFILNMVINLRFYILSYTLIIPRILTFLGSLVSFYLLDEKGIVDMHLSKDTDITIAAILGIVFYSIFGLFYDCKLLILTAIVVLCGYVSFEVWKKTNSKRAALMVLSILAVILIQIGLRFESGSFNGLFWFGVGQIHTQNDTFANKTWELSLTDHYFHSIFF